MTAADISLCLYLTQQIAELAAAMRRDGLANSLGHLVKIEERNEALRAVLMGKEPELPV